MSRVLLVTGGGRGIGAATCLLAAQRGYAVAVNYQANSLAADEVVRQVRAHGGAAMAVQADVADEAQVLRMFAQVDAKLGRLDALVNNAGVVDVAQRVDEMDVARWQRMFNTNVIGSMLCAREAVRRMSTRHGGSGGAIVNVSSVAAKLGSAGQYVDYAASKAAVHMMSRDLAGDLADRNITVNAVIPGFFPTKMTAHMRDEDTVDPALLAHIPMKRMGTAEDIAGIVIFLCSRAGAYVTGAQLPVDGGIVGCS